MDNNKEQNISIFICTFSATVQKANVLIKFPCQYFLSWKTTNGKKIVEGKTRATAKNSIVEFNQSLQLITEMIFDNSTKTFSRKDTQLSLNLISKSRQDQVKLIGRITIDLASIANLNYYQFPKSHKLSYCSVDAELTFSAVFQGQRPSHLNLQELDKSSFNDFFSFYSCASSPNINDHHSKPDFQNTQNDETSIAFIRNLHEKANNYPHQNRHSKTFNQTFFFLNSPTSKRNLETARGFRQREMTNQSKRSSNIQSEFGFRSTSRKKEASNSRSTQLTNLQGTRPINAVAKQQISQDQSQLERQKNNLKAQFEDNKRYIKQLQKKITQISSNLQQSRWSLEESERQNLQKQQMIKQLKQNQNKLSDRLPKKSSYFHLKEHLDLEAKIDLLNREGQSQLQKWKAKEQMYKHQIHQYQTNMDLLKKEIDQLRKMRQDNKNHYQQQIQLSQRNMRQKQQKIQQLSNKIEGLLKYKYQYEIVKELTEQKDEKLKFTEKQLNSLKLEIDQINKSNYSQQIYKLRHQIIQGNKNYEQLNAKYLRNEEQINRYKENYVKMESAFSIQSKNYENCKQKNNQHEYTIFNFQKGNAELQDNLLNAVRNKQQLDKSLHILAFERDELKLLNDTMKEELQLKGRDFQQQIKRREEALVKLQEQNQFFDSQKSKALQSLASMAYKTAQLELNNTQLTQKLSNFQNNSFSQLQKTESIISNLESAIFDKQSLIKIYGDQIQSLKVQNQRLTQALLKNSGKQAELEQGQHKIYNYFEEKPILLAKLEDLQQKYQISIRQNQSVRINKYNEVKNSQKCSLLIENDKSFSQYAQTIGELRTKQSQSLLKIEALSSELRSVQELYQDATKEGKILKNKFQQSLVALNGIQQELLQSRNEESRMKQIIIQLTQRYQQHLKLQEKYNEQLTAAKQEKEELQLLISKNNKEFAIYNQQLEERLAYSQAEIEKSEDQKILEDELKKQIQQKLAKSEQQCYNLHEQLEFLRILLADKTKENNQISKELQSKLQIIANFEHINQQTQHEANKLKENITHLNLQFAKRNSQTQEIVLQLQEEKSTLKSVLAQKNILNRQMFDIREQNSQKSIDSPPHKIYNQLIQIQEEFQVQAANSIIEESRGIQFNYDELHENYNKSTNIIKSLQQKLEKSNQQIQLLAHQLQIRKSQPFYQDFSQFQREQMMKIIEQQKKQIDLLELKSRKSNVFPLQIRIKQLQASIQQIQSTYKLQIDRLLALQNSKQAIDSNSLSIINEQVEQQALKSEKSISSLVSSPNRIKVSFDIAELNELKQKVCTLQQQKQYLQNLIDTSEQQKFNLTSLLNQRQATLQQMIRQKIIIALDNEDMKVVNQSMSTQIQALKAQLDILRNQLNFGTSILFTNEQSVTRSEPAINRNSLNEQTRDIQIEELKLELEKSLFKEEQLTWIIKDLEMQFQNVIDNLVTLNSSPTNLYLLDQTEKERESFMLKCNQSSYTKQKLLYSLRKNIEFKEMAHRIIQKLRENQQQLINYISYLEKDEKMMRMQEHNRIGSIVNGFQQIKRLLAQKKPNQLEQKEENLQITTKMNVFQQKLNELYLITSKTQ